MDKHRVSQLGASGHINTIGNQAIRIDRMHATGYWSGHSGPGAAKTFSPDGPVEAVLLDRILESII